MRTQRILSAMTIAFGLMTATQADAQTPCHFGIDCDCEVISVGPLTGGWRGECRSCEQRLIDACLETYGTEPLRYSVAAGGYCETACSIYGPNAYPPAPPASPPPHDWGVPRPIEMELYCPANAAWSVEELEGVFWQGCRRNDGSAIGIWVATDAEGQVIEEVVLNDGLPVLPD